MGIFGKKKEEDKKIEASPEAKVEVEKKIVDKSVEGQDKKSKKSVKVQAGKKPGGSDQAYRVLVKPLITEKATELGAVNKYIFEVDPSMNKIEVKKAIRSVYNVEPTRINILNFSGKSVRYGRIKGQRKGWKKALVTLKEGDKIAVYEGV